MTAGTCLRCLGSAALVVLGACADAPLENVADATSLEPYPNPFDEAEPLWAPQPPRAKPHDVVVSAARNEAYVSLPGTADEPGAKVVVVDLGSLEVVREIDVGTGPMGMALHPDGDVLVVANRFSNFVSVVDLGRGRVEHAPAVDFYVVDVAFGRDGDVLYLANQWRDAVAVWGVERSGRGLGIASRDEPGIEVGANPSELAVSPGGETLAVASMTDMTVSLVDTATGAEVERVDLGAPANGLAFAGDYVLVATTSASTHHFPRLGPDTDGDGEPGDGTPNVNFQDLQNEIAVLRADTGEQVWRYTSDTICCKDYRDVDPDHAAVDGDLLTPRSTWIVGGALPEQIAVRDDAVYVTYGASNQVQRFRFDASDGSLEPEAIWDTAAHNPRGLALTDDRVLVLHRLGETLRAYDADGELDGEVEVGELGEGFPATDAEIGELFNSVTAPFTVDGDQSCTHCHREGGNLKKAFSMPLTRYPGVGLRMAMAYRGAADTRPWFFESAMDETNFRPVMNEFARIENFCCSDYTMWPDGTPPAGCGTDPPPECTSAPNPSSTDGVSPTRDPEVEPYLHPRPTASVSRDAFFLAQAKAVIGRVESFGDGVFFEDPITEERRPVPLDFEGITRALGVFLLTDTNLLPNPNDPESPAALRGRALFESATTACATCHPPPSFAVSTDVNPFDQPIVMGPVVTPNRAADGTNLDLFADGFVETFPRAEMESCEEVCGEAMCTDEGICDDARNVRFGVPSLRGIWDRAPMFLHDGRAKSLREVLCTPGHPALQDGEVGYNERDGIVDTHGATSHLSPEDIDDLIAYMLTL